MACAAAARAPRARSRAAAHARAAPRARGRVAFVLSMLRKPSIRANTQQVRLSSVGPRLGLPMLQGHQMGPTDGPEPQRTRATVPESPATAQCRTRTYPCTLPACCSPRPGGLPRMLGTARRVSTSASICGANGFLPLRQSRARGKNVRSCHCFLEFIQVACMHANLEATRPAGIVPDGQLWGAAGTLTAPPT